MDIARVGHVRAFRTDGAVNHVLLRWGKFDARNLLVTWTVMAPGGQRRGHTHAGSEQVYLIVRGSARMEVDHERQLVSAGALVYIPPGTRHGVSNAGPDELVYITAASPPFPMERLYAETGATEVHAPEPEVTGV
jgi:mannose-6-phosphate isomerase-like protein (cupin superfamily)